MNTEAIPTIAVVFDGGLVVDRRPKMGEPVPSALKFVLGFRALGAEIIITTSRSGKSLEAAKQYCKKCGIKVDAWTDLYPEGVDVIVDARAWGCPRLALEPRKRNLQVPHPVDWDALGGNILEFVRRRMQAVKG